MDYGGTDKRRTKKDLKRKRIARGYKRGGKFRCAEVSEIDVAKKEANKSGNENSNVSNSKKDKKKG